MNYKEFLAPTKRKIITFLIVLILALVSLIPIMIFGMGNITNPRIEWNLFSISTIGLFVLFYWPVILACLSLLLLPFLSFFFPGVIIFYWYVLACLINKVFRKKG